MVYSTGDKYEGDFKDGLREGVGVYTYFKEEGPGNRYEGEWLANKKHGIGKMTFGVEGEYFGRFEERPGSNHLHGVRQHGQAIAGADRNHEEAEV